MAPMHALLFLIFLLPLWGAPAQAQVYRCGNAYSDAPCPNGRAVDVSPQVSDPGGPRTTLIYLCRQPGNKRLHWNAAPCHASAMALERSERVPAHLDWAEQVAFANRLYAQAQATTAAAEAGQVHAVRQSDSPVTLAAKRSARHWKRACGSLTAWAAPAASITTWTGYEASARKHAMGSFACSAGKQQGRHHSPRSETA